MTDQPRRPFPVATGPIDDRRNQPKGPGFGQPEPDPLEEMIARIEANLDEAKATQERVIRGLEEQLAALPHIAALTLRPGDHIVITVTDELTVGACRRMKEQAEERFPGHEVTVIRANGVYVMRPETEAA